MRNFQILIIYFTLFLSYISFGQSFKKVGEKLNLGEEVSDTIEMDEDTLLIVNRSKYDYLELQNLNPKTINHYIQAVNYKVGSFIKHWDYKKPIRVYVSRSLPKIYKDSLIDFAQEINSIKGINILIVSNGKNANISFTKEEKHSLVFQSTIDYYKKYPENEKFDIYKHIGRRAISDTNGEVFYTSIRVNLDGIKNVQEMILKLKRHFFLAVGNFNIVVGNNEYKSYTNWEYKYNSKLTEFDKKLLLLHLKILNSLNENQD